MMKTNNDNSNKTTLSNLKHHLTQTNLNEIFLVKKKLAFKFFSLK